MKEFALLINGALIYKQEQLEVINPATEQVFASAPRANEDDLNQAVVAARNAANSWALTDIETRQAMLNKIADAIHANTEALTHALTSEQGKPLEAAAMEIQYAEAFIRYFATLSLEPEVLLDDENQRIEISRKPLGVVAAIIPWNYPLLIAVYKLAPALLAGNSLIIKPAPTTPIATLMLGEILCDIVPQGLVNVLVDQNDLGARLSSHPGIAKISFTGSTPTGKAVMASAAGTLKRLTLELGGNDAAIVLDDADPKTTAQGVFNSAFMNSGQVCIALKRLYVHEAIYDQVCDELAALTRQAIVADGSTPGAQFGPIQNKAQYNKVCEYIADARNHGNIIAGGEIKEAPGYFVPLTVVKDISDGCRVVDEEPFGPVLPVIKFSDVDDAIALANNSPYGLGGSVWSSDLERATTLAARLECGTAWVNQHTVFGPHIPFPATKESGIGVEFSREGLLEFTSMQVINVNKVL
ncbi:MAG: aldehyde dehydrogenase family protein [Halioglobus sp.]